MLITCDDPDLLKLDLNSSYMHDFIPDFRIAPTAIASVLAVIAANSAACCQYHPSCLMSKMYSSTGSMMKTLAKTMSKAKEMTCSNICSPYRYIDIVSNQEIKTVLEESIVKSCQRSRSPLYSC